MALPESPITRGEVFLNAVANSDASGLPTPVTRREKYLSSIAAGDSSGIPDAPYTREEQYLDYIAKNGGGGSGSSDLAVWKVGYVGNGEAETSTSITFKINGYSGKYALLSILHRNDLTAPSGCVLIDKTTFEDQGTTQYVSLYKYAITTDTTTLAFTQANGRICGTIWVVSGDYQLEKTDTKEFEYYTTSQNVKSTALSFLTFSAPIAQTSNTSIDVIARSDGIWMCQPIPHYTAAYQFKYTYQLRHFTGIIPPSATEKTSWVKQEVVNPNTTISNNAKAQVCVYSIVPA